MDVKTNDGGRRGARILWVTVAVVGVVTLAWFLARWAVPYPQYSLIGTWRAESTEILGLGLPIGINLIFTERSARLIDTEIHVAQYDQERDRVKVVLDSGPRVQMTMTFVFEDRDHMYFAGPLGLRLRYKRMKSPARRNRARLGYAALR